jgi:tetratricopeptide (TPR) repeat protein
MYQMWTGIAAYEAEANAARHEQAAKLNVDPEHLRPDLSAAGFDQAREHLETAVAIEPALWRAQYYLGKIARDVGREQEAAERFTAAIRGDRQQQAPYIVLAELYRKWDYTQEAIAVATLGTKELPPSPAVSNVYYVLGMAYGEQRKYKQAIEA